tara:strand:- start:434 stop:805 length:372 start_codon:yes stop_codon:yes gene_type:complete
MRTNEVYLIRIISHADSSLYCEPFAIVGFDKLINESWFFIDDEWFDAPRNKEGVEFGPMYCPPISQDLAEGILYYVQDGGPMNVGVTVSLPMAKEPDLRGYRWSYAWDDSSEPEITVQIKRLK